MLTHRFRDVVLIVALLGAPTLAQPNPSGDKTANPNHLGEGQDTLATVAVNPDHIKRGTVFYVADPMKRDIVTFTSEALLEDIVGTTHALAGYVIFDPQYAIMGIRASFAVSTASLTTGIPVRDEHLRSPEWLDAQSHPMITFTVEDTKDIFLVKESETFQTYHMTLIGPFSLRGQTQTMQAPARVTFLKESPQTKQKMPGDLLAVRARVTVPLIDFGITGPKGTDLIGSKVSEAIAVEVSLFASSVKPQPGHPCNPCHE